MTIHEDARRERYAISLSLFSFLDRSICRDVDFIRHKFASLSLSFFPFLLLLHRSTTRPSVPPLSKKPLRSLDFTRRVNRILYLGFAACRPANCFFRVCIGEPVERRRGKRRAPPLLRSPPRREQGDDEFGRYENLGRPFRTGADRTVSRTAFELRPCTGCFDKRDPLLSSNNYCVPRDLSRLDFSHSSRHAPLFSSPIHFHFHFHHRISISSTDENR